MEGGGGATVELYKLALIYKLIHGHTHLSHSFIINAFSLKLLKDSLKYQWFYLSVPSVYTGKISELFVKPVVRHETPITAPVPLIHFLSHFIHTICVNRTTHQNLDFPRRREGEWEK